jgi:septal ring factor EnvC (AmiA/AmiB activator)
LALDSILHKTALMNSVMRPLPAVRRPAIAVLGVVPLGLMTGLATIALAQTAPRPSGEVPYLNFPPAFAPSSPSNDPAPAPGLRPSDVPGAKGPTVQDTIKQRDQELSAIRAEQQRALENEAKLKREIEAIGDDRRKLNAQLIEAAARVRNTEAEISKTMEKLAPLDEREKTLRASFEERRGVIVEVLAALQRIGRQPPPVMLARPEDALEALRSAMLLGAVLPELRNETQSLLADLAELARLRKGIAEARERLDRDLKTLAEDSPRLTALIAQRQKQQAEIETTLSAERARALQLGRQVDNLQDLVANLNRSQDSANRQTRLAARPGDEKKVDSRPDLNALKDPGRLAPAVAFASAKKMLPLPVNGVRIREYGAPDGLGGSEKGLSIATRNGSQVTAPCDGWVVYAGPFRNYGQLLILNAGDGYHVLLAGMERISVDLGQFVVTGEPVAVMGSRSQATATIAAGSGQPVLYVEFRKDGTPVDPGPWWAASEVEKVRG